MGKKYDERHELSLDKIQEIFEEPAVLPKLQDYFRNIAGFLLLLEKIRVMVETGSYAQLCLEELQTYNHMLYQDILPESYDTCYGNPEFIVNEWKEEYASLLCVLYAEMRSGIPHAFEAKKKYLTILNELFLQVYGCFEDEDKPSYDNLKSIIYWYASDYCDVFLKRRIVEQINPKHSFAVDMILDSDLDDVRYLYQFGEYVSENTLATARHIASLPEETLQKMADVYTEGFRVGFVNNGKDLSIKNLVNIYYSLGFEKVIKLAIENFAKLGLKTAIFRTASSVITRKEHRNGYAGAIANPQYDYDHRYDQALFLDKKYTQRRLDVMKAVFDKRTKKAAGLAGPAVMETFGEKPFAPVAKKEALAYDDKQRQWVLEYDSKASILTNQYIKQKERSFTIVSYPVPEIGANFKEIFHEVIQINTLDASLYEVVQQKLIDVLDLGEYAHILGAKNNQTDLKVSLYQLENPDKETVFENCVADVNIPVGEVFTTPVLEGTNGVLHVEKVFLHGLQYRDLKLTFVNGKITDYACKNFDSVEENKKFIRDNLFYRHPTLPISEFAIGTNTTAFVFAQKYGIEEKLPILITEKMGPHFAIGDSCFSWNEDNPVYNHLNGKEMVARDNSISIQREEDPGKAYFQCHTDITIPYNDLQEISVVTKDGNKIILIKDGRFVLPGTEILNEPFDSETGESDGL
ncbi:MAG: aminopeptidase [Lachnospiraceae bacterium]|nr:aminopeptidase [Lachnospiraceae bacterium]